MASKNNASSRYSQTPIKDFYLDLWPGIDIPPSANDIEIEIATKYHERPDLFAHDMYGTVNLWWTFAIRNPDILFDPIYDFKAGVKIFVPSLARLEDLV